MICHYCSKNISKLSENKKLKHFFGWCVKRTFIYGKYYISEEREKIKKK